jgi:hypothetical protein
MSLRDHITPASVLSYARAAISVARICDDLGQRGYKTMVVPSRGAVPVIRVAEHYQRAAIQPAVSGEDRLALLRRGWSNPLGVTFHAPFTADTGPIGVQALTTADIRRFWVRVIAALVRGETNSPYYRFYRFARDRVCQVGHHDNFEWKIRSGKFVFIDTVVSGQAVVEISEAFAAEGLMDIHYILLFDQNGAGVAVKYKEQLHRLRSAGRATFVYMDDLFTEDQGPAVSGVWSVVMPDLMELARAEIPAFSDGVVGAGLYYHEVMRRPDKTNEHVTVGIASLSMVLDQAMRMSAHADIVAEDIDRLGLQIPDEASLHMMIRGPEIAGRWFDENVDRYLDHVEKHHLFSQSGTANLARARIVAGAPYRSTLSVSSSHCLRMGFEIDDTAKLVREFKASLSEPYAVE